MSFILESKNLDVITEGKSILGDFSLSVEEGKIEALMGPNGSGKSSFACALMGHPKYEVASGEILFKGQDITNLKTEERAKLGMFLAFQYPISIEGVSLANLLYSAQAGQNPFGMEEEIEKTFERLNLSSELADRSINQGASGGEKKKVELAQMILLNPSFVILDEVDSGLDVDSLKIVAEEVKRMNETGVTFLVITHYPRLLEFLKPDKVHICKAGRVQKSGGVEVVEQIEKSGYAGV